MSYNLADGEAEIDLMTALYKIDEGLDSLRFFAGETGRIFALIADIYLFGPVLTGEGTAENEKTGALPPKKAETSWPECAGVRNRTDPRAAKPGRP